MKGIKLTSYRALRLFLTLFITLGIFVITAYLIRNNFRVKEIEFLGEGMNIEFDARKMSGNTIFFPSQRVRQELLQTYPQLEDVIIKKKFPHTITIIPVLRHAYAQLVTSMVSYGLDSEGIVVEVGINNQNLPQIVIDVPVVRVGMRVEDPNVRMSLEFLQRIQSILPVSSIRTSDDGSSLQATSNQTVILFTQSETIETLISTLQTVVTGVRIKGTMPKMIDVRFSKPVIQW